jgi:release factor glutamine methyltransferase
VSSFLKKMPIAKTKEESISELLQEGTRFLERQGIVSPRRETELLLCTLLSCRRVDLYLDPGRPVLSDHVDAFRKQLARRVRREPIQYITGEVAFCSLSLLVRPGVFIPRPETELIVEKAGTIQPPPQRILDLCTGSGALAIALAKKIPQAHVVATDIEEMPLKIARANAERHDCLSQTHFVQGDLFAPFRAESDRFDLIVCNPPYIPERDRPTLQPEVRDYEPALALFAPEEGTAFYRRILREAPAFLTQAGHLLLELGAGQSVWFQEFTRRETAFSVTFLQDIAGIDRIAICRRRGAGG